MHHQAVRWNPTALAVAAASVTLAGCGSTPPSPPEAPEPQTVADLRARGAVRMSADEARAATVGTRVQTASGSAWTHDPDGSLSMLVRQRDFSGLMSFGGSGKWEVRQNGAYCVNITWQIHAHSFPEAWCVDLYALDGVTWAAPRRRGGAPDTAPVRRVQSYRPIVQEPARP